jgi:hypothetical protein
MKSLTFFTALLSLAAIASPAQLIVGDDSDVTGSGTGFGLDAGINSGINPPTTRLTGSAADNLRYLFTATGTTKSPTAYSITGGKQQIAFSANSGRYTLSADGSTAFDFASALGTSFATAANPVVYDIGISMANANSGTVRFSFALGTAESNANVWDFGLQLHRAAAANTFYTIQKRVDQGSYNGASTSDAVGDRNDAITTLGAGSYGSEINFLIRVTDAGAESGADYNSRLQLSMDGGSSWFYDTSTDSLINNRWRLDGAGRFLSWDQAGGNASGQVTYDNFSVNIVTPAPEPSVVTLGLLTGIGAILWRRKKI